MKPNIQDYSKSRYIVRNLAGTIVGRIDNDEFVRNDDGQRLFRIDGDTVYGMDGNTIGFIEGRERRSSLWTDPLSNRS